MAIINFITKFCHFENLTIELYFFILSNLRESLDISAHLHLCQWVSCTVHNTHKLSNSTKLSLKLSFMALFTHLKIILLQCFQSDIKISLNVCLTKISFVNLFFLLFMDSTILFGIIHVSHCTISANFYLYLQYFK